MTAIDPMHCLFEGVAKKVWNVWREDGTITDETLDKIDETIAKVSVNNSIGRIPTRMANRTRMKADEWKNWTLYYSLL